MPVAWVAMAKTDFASIDAYLATLPEAARSVLEEVRAVLPLDDFVLGQLSPTELLIDPQRLRELLQRLDARGLSALVRKL